jgi:hypothetical protein
MGVSTTRHCLLALPRLERFAATYIVFAAMNSEWRRVLVGR